MNHRTNGFKPTGLRGMTVTVAEKTIAVRLDQADRADHHKTAAGRASSRVLHASRPAHSRYRVPNVSLPFQAF